MKRTIVNFALSALSLLPAGAFADLIVEHGGHTYKLVTAPTTWDDANAIAEAMTLGDTPGYLARIDSAAENEALLAAAQNHLTPEQISQTGVDVESGAAFVWLGGSDSAAEGHWIWASSGEQFWLGDFNGQPVQGRYTNWGVQPDNSGAGEDSLAMALNDWPEPFYDLGSEGQWNDVNGAVPLFFWVEFDALSDIRLVVEEPLSQTTYSGIGSLRGWAISSDQVVSIEVYVDGEYRFEIPHGGYRADVGAAFEDIENAALSGFASAVNFSLLGQGGHEVMVVLTDAFGSQIRRNVNFNVVRFDRGFIQPGTLVELGWSDVSALSDSITVIGAAIGGELYNLILEWRTSTQAFEIVQITKAQ